MTKRSASRNTLSRIADLLDRPLATRLDYFFRAVEMAEEEIATAKSAFPEHARELHQSFRALQPTPILIHHGAERLLRAHFRELLDRVRLGRDLRAATAAEIAGVLSALSLEAPLDRPATILYSTVFAALFPNCAERLQNEVGPVLADSHEQESARVLERRLSRMLTAPWRVAPSPCDQDTAA